MTRLQAEFFDNDAQQVARNLLGKVVRHHYRGHWLAARIIETEAYYRNERASHSSLGHTPSRRAMFMPAGTIYMYHARGHPSLNISTGGQGDAVLIKSAFPYEDEFTDPDMIACMGRAFADDRPPERLCRGQTLLCRALHLSVEDWNAKQFDAARFYIDDVGLAVPRVIQASRLGIAVDRNADLPYRFIDYEYAAHCTKNPLTMRAMLAGRDYQILV
ncbi:MAG: DNA-3-methyladenine glycosylase [Proteobacteria bacterium]|nr:DNA-3-methyladenine glycosylase [Pseudomonadota bacterium]